MNKVAKNITANYLGKLWGFLSIFVFVRFYIEILGIESYAIINFYAVILGLLAFADAGLTATLNRELARDIDDIKKLNLVYTFERIYIIICLIIILSVCFFANNLASNFLKSSNYSESQVAYYMCLMGFGVALQLFATLFEGGLLGLQHQVLTNKIRIIWSFFRSGIVLLPLYLFPKLDVFFLWQILCNMFLLFFLRTKLYEFLPNKKPHFSKKLLNSIAKYALGMMGIALISGINIQIDKLITSKYLTATLFGHYSIASLVAQLPVMLVTPIIVAIFPLLASSVSQNDHGAVIENFHKYSFFITAIITPIALCIALYSNPLVTLWTGKADIALSIDHVIKILILGGFFLCLQLTPFYLALANGFTKINLYTGVFGLIVIIPLMIYSIRHYGMIGAAFPWVILNISSFLAIGLYSVNRFLKNHVSHWLIWDILAPVVIVGIIAFMVEVMFSKFSGQYIFILKSFLIGIISITLNLLIQNIKYPDYVVINIVSFYNLIKGKMLK